MINSGNIRHLLAAAFIAFSGVTGYSQNADCKVSMPSISGTYSGDCKKGLAHGHGTSQGIDNYSGNFRFGLPHGTGIYTWSNGSRYEGNWSKGMKDGAGKMVTRDSTYTGIWKEDVYIGKEVIAPYRVTHSQNITKWSFFKSKSTYNAIRIRFYQGAVEGGGLISVDIATSTGEQYRDGGIYGIQHPSFPIEVRIRFTAMNSLGMSQFTGDFVFTITEPGAWDIKISY
ncbi:MAG: hypothetical protein MUF36_07130 [Bacteroidales bacterium]|jgi:hypothetical protein|nr:hypothetical protein [Bacteroidales bacterium]